MQTFGPVFIRYDWSLIHHLYTYPTGCSVGDSFGAHLYSMAYPSTDLLDWAYVTTANTTFARLARYVLLNDGRSCDSFG